jgi:hypothetical protein
MIPPPFSFALANLPLATSHGRSDPHAFPVHLPVMVASKMFDPKKPGPGVTFRLCGIAMKFQE